MEDKRNSIMERVQKLLNKAESTPYGPEQEALLAKADKLMVEYTINEHDLAALGGVGQTSEPVKFEVPVCGAGTHIWYEMTQMCQDVMRFFGGRAVYSGLQGKGRWAITGRGVAFPEQVQAIQALFNSLKLQLLQNISPKWDHLRSMDDNIVAMKDAGMTWSQIYDQLKKSDEEWTHEPETRNQLGKVKRLYDRRKEALGEESTKANPKNYQRNFAIGFEGQICTRLMDIKEARRNEQVNDTANDGTSVALVLASKADRVEAAFKEYYGGGGRGVGGTSAKVNMGARGAGSSAGRNADLSGASRNVGGSKGAIGR